MWNRKEIESFIEKAAALGSVLGLDNMYHLMKELGNIQEELSVIHIAGTNGKGSVGAMLEKILQLSGYSVGRYSSPAVFCPEEKYQVNGNAIQQEEFISIMQRIADACETMKKKGLSHPTLFEIETAAAFLWFYEKKCQVVILETGLGGAMDATNIIRKPLCSVITSVSMDHMGILGNTLGEIAGEKAGIIKKNCPVITLKQKPEAQEVFEQVSRENNSELLVADGAAIVNIHYENGYLVFDWENFEELQLSLLGTYQTENAICAIRTVEQLKKMGFLIEEKVLRQALQTVCWNGRFEIISKNPLMVIDGAHNEDAAKKLRKTLEMGFTNYQIIYIIGVLADKEHEKILQYMLPLAEEVVTLTPNNPRALAGEILKQEALKYHKNVHVESNVSNALKYALLKARELEQPMILAFGSLSYLGEMKQEMLLNKCWKRMNYDR